MYNKNINSTLSWKIIRIIYSFDYYKGLLIKNVQRNSINTP